MWFLKSLKKRNSFWHLTRVSMTLIKGIRNIIDKVIDNGHGDKQPVCLSSCLVLKKLSRVGPCRMTVSGIYLFTLRKLRNMKIEIEISLCCDWSIQNKPDQSNVSSRTWLSRQSQLCRFRSLLSLFQFFCIDLFFNFWRVNSIFMYTSTFFHLWSIISWW